MVKGKDKNKKQIILCHTSRESKEFLDSLSLRYNGKYDKIPNYLIERDGSIINLLQDDEYTSYFQNEKINKKSIIISLENLGWLEKRPLKDDYINWKGDIYSGEIFNRKWRDYIFWQPYTEIQYKQLGKLCLRMMDKFGIDKQVIEHNTKIEGIEKFSGVVSRSNFNTLFTDLNPSFDFEKLKKIIKDVEYT